MAVREEIRRLSKYRYSERRADVKLDQNESPDDLPEVVKKALLARLADVPFHRYPELDARHLRCRIAEKVGWSEEGVVVAGGSNVLIRSAVIAAGIGRKVLTVRPNFPVYADQARQLAAELVELPLGRDFELPMEQLEGEIASGEGVLFLANPAAPTGNLFGPDRIERIAERTARRWVFVIDEAYHQFAGTSSLPLVERYSHVVSLRTFSKAFGLGGVRIGYALAQPGLAAELQKTVMPFSVSGLQVAAAEAALGLDHLVRERVEATRTERSRISSRLAALGLHPYPSETNFILFRVEDPEGVFEGLLRHGVLIRRQDHLAGLEGSLRVTVGRRDENDRFLEALEAVVGGNAGG